MNSEPELDLFGVPTGDPFDLFLQSLRQMAEDLVRKWQLPLRGVEVTSNFGQKGGPNEEKIVSYSVSLKEPDYPATDVDLLDKNRVEMKCITFTPPKTKVRSNCVEVLPIKNIILERVGLPKDALRLPQDTSDSRNDSQKLAIPMNAPGIVEFFKDVVELKLKVYESARATPFGCCSLFEECSDAKRCIHPNRLYSTACAYRRNLESGRIFYGKNKNI